MGKKLTQEQFQEKVNKASSNLYEVISIYNGKTKPVTLKCKKHNVIFTVTAECFMRITPRGKCPECFKEKRNEKLKDSRTEVECAYCGKKFFKPNSKLENSRSGLYFCCREHKDLAQSFNFDCKEIQPNHYNKETSQQYRSKAFRNYEHKCLNCGWNEDERILQVHHIDENRDNNDINNLCILCPTCHAKITYGYYKLVNNKLVKIK